MLNKMELLAPAGDLEKLKIAIEYGADAVYFGGELFSLRAGAGNFSLEDMKEGISFAHKREKKCYLTINIFPHNDDIIPIKTYLEKIKDLSIDGFIVSDPGIMELIKEVIGNEAEIHLSTQANTTNYKTATFWYKQGVRRIVVAREMTLSEIGEFHENIPSDMEIEAFVHGAMCISYSGRCLLSNFMIGRDANQGMCAHPCRWNYALVEEQRPGEYYPIEEDERGTYILNSKDICMVEHISELAKAGITSLKIEGRMKSVFYVATVVKAYRDAIDAYKNKKEIRDNLKEELRKVSHREFTTGFYFDKPGDEGQNYQTSAYTRDYTFIGIVKDYNEKTGLATIEQRNKMVVNDEIEVFGPDIDSFAQKIEVLLNEDDENIESAPHPQQIVKIKMKKPVCKNYILRKEKGAK